MKLLGIILLATATVTVTARHRKEWQKVDPLKADRERFQTFYKSDIPACTRGAGFYRDPQDCHQFIRCVDEFGNGRQFSVFVGRCEPGLVFDENVSACNWPELAAPCSNSPQKFQEIRKPFRPEQVPEDNVVSEEKTWNKPYHVQQQQVVQEPQTSIAYETQQVEVPVVQEIQIAAQEPIYQDKIEEVSIETQSSEDPFEGQAQEEAYEENVQVPIIQEQEYQENIQVPEIQEQVYQENAQVPEIQEQVYQENVQAPEVQQQNFQEPIEQHAHNEQNIKQSEQQIIYHENNQNDRNHGAVRPEQVSSSGFQEVIDQESQQFEIPQQESQTDWWVPEENPNHNPPDVADQIPASEANQEAVFCSQEGFYRHPENCSQFIRCVKIERGAYAVHFFECPKQLVFDEKDSACIVADIHSCRSNTRKKRQASNSKLQCRGEGFFRHPEDCRSFYRCVKTATGSYETHLFSCPANLVFDEEYTTCNWPEKAPPCDSQQQSYKPTRKPAKIVQTERPRSQYKPPSSTTNRRSWSTAKPRNDYLDKSITQETYGKRRSTERPKSTTQSYGKCRSEGFFKNDDDCRKFFKCVKKGNNFVRYDLSCPQNFAYDETSKRCISERYATSCNKNKSPYPPRQDDEETSTISTPETTSARSSSSQSGNDDIACEREGYFRHPEDCNKFYRCVDFEGNGQEFVRYDFTCAEGLVFDEANSVCNWPDQSAPCDTRSGGGQGTGGNDNNETGGNETGENETNDDRKPVTDENATSTSSDRPITESVEASSSAPVDENEQESGSDNESGGPGSENECTKEGFYRNPDDCNKFYRCVDFDGEGKEFVRYDFSCPEGLVFDEANSVCNWPADSEPCDTRSGEESGPEETDNTTSISPDREGESSEGSTPNQQTTPNDNGSSESTPDRNPSSESSSDGSQSSTESSDGGTTGSRRGSSGVCTEEGFFRNPEDCNKFYRCVDQNGDGKQFVKYDFTCPEGLVFDEVNSVCNWPDQSAPCDGESPGRQQSTTSGSRDDGSDSPQTTTSSSRSSSQATTKGTTTSIASTTTERSPQPTDGEGSSSSTTVKSTESGGNEGTSDSSESGSEGKQGECTQEGFFRNPEDCNKFYRCVDFNGDGQEFVRYDFECPEGLVFDEVNSVCNWPDQSPKCEAGSGKSGNETTDSNSRSTSQTESSSEQSQSSTEQSTQSSTEQSTQSSTEQSTQSSTEQSTQSSTRSTTEQSTSDSSTSSDSSECTEPGFHRCKDDCSRFYRCVNENGKLVRYDFKCPEGLIFDDRNKKCDWPSSELTCDTESSGSTTTTANESSTTTSTQASTSSSETSSSGSSRKDCTEEGFFRDPDDCSKYYRCIDEGDGTFTREDFSCAEDEVFDEEMRYCNRKDLAPPCNGSETTSSTSQTTSSQTQITSSESQSTTERSTTTTQSSTESSTKRSSECTEPGFFRCPEDCTKFYRCVEDGNSDNLVRYDFQCPDGLIFDERNGKCDWPSSELTCDTESSTSSSTTQSSTTDSQTSGTTSQSTSSSSTTSSSTSSKSSEGCTEEGFFRNPEDCSKYYRCTDEGDGTLTREDFECAEDEVFDEEMRYCNRKDLAPPCDNTSSTTQSSGSTTAQSPSEQGSESTTSSSGTTSSSSGSGECTEEGFHRDPNNCSKFYRCVDFEGDGQSFTRYDFDCPDGLVFDENNDVCNWPSSVPSCESEESTGNSRSTDSNSESTSETSNSQTSATTSQDTSSSSTTSSSSGTTSSPSDTTSSSSDSTSSKGCTEEGFFRNPEDCRKYYRCTDEGDGTLTREDFECAEDEVFDEEGRYCNRRDLAPPCDDTSSTTKSSGSTASQSSSEQGSESTTSSSGTTSNSSGSGECTEEGFHRDANDCSKFYRCVDFQGDGQSFTRYDFDCPEGLVFDETNDVCNWPSSVPSCESEESTGSSRSPDSKSEATSGTSDSQTSSTTSQGTSSSSTTPSSSDSTSSEGCTEEGFFRNPEDCRKYYRCTDEGNGTLTREDFECAEDEVFDEEGRYCNRRDLAPPCDNTSSTTQSSGSTTSQSSSEQGSESTTSSSGTTSSSSGSGECTEEGFHRDPNDCSKFYRCVDFQGDGQSFTRYDFDCPEGLVFDETNDVCNWPSSVPSCESGGSTRSSSSTDSNSEATSGTSDSQTSGTTSQGTSSSGTTPSSSGSTSSEGCTEEGFFRNPEDCRKYYRCIDEGNGTLTREDFECAEDEVFDEEGRYCNRRDLAPPCDNTSSTTQSSGSTTSQSPSEQGSESTTSSSGTTSSSSATTSSSSGTTSTSSGSGECTEEGFHRDPNDCSKFYRCVDFEGDGQSFTRYDFDCPDGLVFDENNDVCNWPSSVPSCESEGSTRSSRSTDSNSQATSETSDSSTSSTTPAEQYSSTSSTTAAEQTSSTSRGGSSSSGTTSSGGTSSRGSSSSDNIECTEEGFFRHPEDCNKFYRCVDFAGTGESFVRYDFDCPEGLVFDEVNSVCNWPTMTPSCESGSRGSSNNNESSNTDSGDNSSTTRGTSENAPSDGSTGNSGTSQGDSSTTQRDQTTRSATSTTSSSSGEFRCEEEGYFKHPTDCKRYYECKRDEETGELVRIDCECPDGQVWDNEGWYCNAEELSPPCDSSSSFKCREEGFFRDPEDCTRYYRCNRTGPGENDFSSERHQCEDGLVFDENGRYCNAPELSEPCDESSSTSGGTTSGESSGGTTSGESSENTSGNGTATSQSECTREGFFRNPEDCTKYYQCRRNEETGNFDRTDYSCPDGRIFDEESNYCNDPQLSNEPCDSDNTDDSTTTRQAGTNSGTSSRSTSSSGTRRTGGGDLQCTQEGFFRHPNDCGKFYRCVDFSGSGESFVRYDFDCPEGTHFDEVNSVCNWPTMTPPCESNNRLFLK